MAPRLDWFLSRWHDLLAHRTAAVAVAASVTLVAALVALPTIDASDGDASSTGRVETNSPSDFRETDGTTVSDLDEESDAGSGDGSPTQGGGSSDPAPGGEPGPGSPTGGGETPAPGPGGGGGGGAAPATGPGVSDTEIKIGFWIVNTDAGCSSIGLTDGGTSCNNEDRGQINALAQYVNDHGGVAGRKLVPVIHQSDAANGTFAGQAQAACAAFTEDNQVLAVVSEGQVGRPFMANCLAERGTPVIDPGFWPFDDQQYADLGGFLYQPSRPRPERWVAAYIDGLAAQGFFGPGVTVGLLRYDAAPFDRVTEKVLKPRLAAHGQELAEDIEIQTPDSVAAFGQMNQEIGNAILRLRSRGVDRVIFFATHGEMAVFYFQQAEAQSYRPRYGMSSMESFRLQSQQGPTAQFADAVGVGWLPQFDVAANDDPGGSATAELCKQIVQGAGLEGGAGRHTHCDSVFFLDTVLDRAPSLDAGGFRSAVEGLGSSFAPAGTFATQFGPGRYDGPAGLRFVAWEPACECFRYQGGTRPLP